LVESDENGCKTVNSVVVRAIRNQKRKECMTGMQLIVPLLEEDETSQPGDMARNEGPNETNGGEDFGDADAHHGRHLPHGLRESFEAMKSIWRQVSRQNEEESVALEDLRHKERQQAIETALAIESEVAKWQNSIAELEAMLASVDNEEDNDDNYSEQEDEESFAEEVPPVPGVRFPLLPPVVVPEDDLDETTLSRSGSQTDLSDSPEMERISG